MNVETLLTLAYKNVNYVSDSEISQTAGNKEHRCTQRVGGNGKGLSPSKRRLELTFPTVTTLGAGDVAQSVECSLSMLRLWFQSSTLYQPDMVAEPC